MEEVLLPGLLLLGSIAALFAPTTQTEQERRHIQSMNTKFSELPRKTKRPRYKADGTATLPKITTTIKLLRKGNVTWRFGSTDDGKFFAMRSNPQIVKSSGYYRARHVRPYQSLRNLELAIQRFKNKGFKQWSPPPKPIVE